MKNVSEAFIAQARAYLTTDYLPKIERCLEKLSDDQVWWRPNPDSNSIGNLVLHLSGNARQWIVSGVGGGSDARDRAQEFAERSLIPRAELMKRLSQAVAEVDAVLAQLDLATLLEPRRIQDCDVSVLDAIFHVVEHFSMHTGQIVMMTKMMTGSDLRFYDFSGGVPEPSWKA